MLRVIVAFVEVALDDAKLLGSEVRVCCRDMSNLIADEATMVIGFDVGEGSEEDDIPDLVVDLRDSSLSSSCSKRLQTYWNVQLLHAAVTVRTGMETEAETTHTPRL